MGTQILIIDTDERRASIIADALAAAGYLPDCAYDSIEGLIVVEEERPRLVILNWQMPGITGAIFTQVLRTGLDRPPPVVALLQEGEDEAAVLAAGACGCLRVPPDLDALVREVQGNLGHLRPT